eukprot:g5689.t1
MLVLLRVNPERGDWVLRTFDVGGRDFQWWGLVTSLLLHSPDSLLHLIGNMLFLWVFGPSVEDRFGRFGFLGLYLLGGIASGGLHAAFDANPAIGASGAIAGVEGAFLVLFPRTRIKCFWIFTISVVLVPAWWFIGLAMAWDLLSHAFRTSDNIARLAHLGGYGFGFGLSMLLLWAKVFPRETYDLFTIFKQAQRRRAFRAAGAMAPASGPAAAMARQSARNERSDALAGARAEVSAAVSSGDLDEAATKYRSLVETYGDQPGAATLARDAQYKLAAHLVGAGDYEGAAAAYERFIEAYPVDREIEPIRLMLGRLHGRYLGQRDRALELLTGVLEGSHSEELRELAREEIDHLNGEAASPRAIGPAAGLEIIGALPLFVTPVGVVADLDVDAFCDLEAECPAPVFQLHGREDEKTVRACGPGVVKAFKYDAATIDSQLKRWDAIDEVEAVLIDGSSGGEGTSFDWDALGGKLDSFSKRVILAGGLHAGNVGEAIRAVRPYAVDVSSGVESAPGVKDLDKIRAFCAAVRAADA